MSILATPSRSKTLSTQISKVTSCVSTLARPQSQTTHRSRKCNPQQRLGNNTRRAVRGNAEQQAKILEEVFIQSLVEAGSCKSCTRHSHRTKWTSRSGGAQNTQQLHLRLPTGTPKRVFSTSASVLRRSDNTGTLRTYEDEQEEKQSYLGKSISRAQYADIGNTYPSASDLWELQTGTPAIAPKPPALIAKAPPSYLPLAPRLIITPEQEDRPPHIKRKILPPEDEEHARQIQRLTKYVKNQKSTIQIRKAWKLYTDLRTPRPRYLSDATISRLFAVFSRVEFKTLMASKRYFALLDECLASGVPLDVGQWNTAIAFAGRWVKRTSKEELRAAVEMWMRMESSLDGGNVQPDNITFNILFDVAVRAGRFALADTIQNELIARGMPLNRYFRTSVIHYAGLRGTGNGVRQAFKELVNAGEIVDTAVMNCVILGLVRSGEAPSAENVFQKMKEMHVTKFGTAGPRDWRSRRELGRKLNSTAISLRKEREQHASTFFGYASPFLSDERKEEAQRAAPIHPDFRTCQILIHYHALRSGNLPRIRELIQEIEDGGWHVHGSVYLDIFKGFYLFGGHAYTHWTRAALESFWKEFLGAVRSAPVIEEGEIVSTGQMSAVRVTENAGASEIMDFVDDAQDLSSQELTFEEAQRGSGDDASASMDGSDSAVPDTTEHSLEDTYLRFRALSPASQNTNPTARQAPTVDADLNEISTFSPFDSTASSPPDNPQTTATEPRQLPRDLASTLLEEDMAEDSLEEVVLDNESLAPYFTPHLARAIIYAFYNCAGRPKMLRVFAEIKDVWGALGMSEDEREGLEGLVGRLGV